MWAIIAWRIPHRDLRRCFGASRSQPSVPECTVSPRPNIGPSPQASREPGPFGTLGGERESPAHPTYDYEDESGRPRHSPFVVDRGGRVSSPDGRQQVPRRRSTGRSRPRSDVAQREAECARQILPSEPDPCSTLDLRCLWQPAEGNNPERIGNLAPDSARKRSQPKTQLARDERTHQMGASRERLRCRMQQVTQAPQSPCQGDFRFANTVQSRPELHGRQARPPTNSRKCIRKSPEITGIRMP